jgi:hypothetical protein
MKRVRPRLPFSASLRMTCCLASSSRTWRDGTVHCVMHCLVHCVVHCVVRQVTQGLCSAPRLAHQPASQVRAARPQAIDVRRVAVGGELAAQVQPEDVAEVVGEDVVVSELGELDVER